MADLNIANMSDFFFGNYEGKRLQFSRKQAGELVGGIDEAEKQLADYYHNADENYQIVEGIISPDRLKIKGAAVPVDGHQPISASTRDLGTKLFCYKIEPGGFIERGHSFSAVNDSLIAAWIHRLAKVGIPTYYTINWVGTARLLSAIYRNEQKPPEEHSTLQRIVRPRIYIKEHDPFVKSLLFLSNAYQLGVGEVKAKALADKFVNILDLATADIAELVEVEGIGKSMATKILKSLGRSID
ncbi:hypothetical protein LCGC14_0409030 [marine sediment metagenome]|uniref:DisA/LigA helix-hairpin-helix motif domain-containing protein n=1 Tax=marine sediment metagenome TaxID=412755 RepID=A0A0F9VGL3_9ZZZZ